MYTGENIALVPFNRDHAERTRQWMNDPELSLLLGRARPVSDREHERWLADTTTRSDCVFFAVQALDDGRHVGNVWLCDIDSRHRKAELRIVLGDTAARGRGWGAETLRLACRYAFDRLNLHKVYAHVLDVNPAAQRAFAAAGFVEEGVLRADRWIDGRYADVHLVACFQDAPETPAKAGHWTSAGQLAELS